MKTNFQIYRNRLRSFALIIFLILWMVLVIACMPKIQSVDNTFKIGWIGPLSGPAAILGVDARLSAQMAVDDINSQGGINGKIVELVVEDDQYEHAKTVTAYHRLKDVEGVRIILLETYGSVFSLALDAEKDGILIFDALDCEQEMANLGKNIFCIAPLTEDKAKVLANQANKLGFQKVGILYNNEDTFMPKVKDFFIEHFNGKTWTQAYDSTTKDFKTPLLKMQQEGIQNLVFLGYDEIAIAMRQARDLGFNGSFFSTGIITNPQIQHAAGGAANGTYYGFWDPPNTDNYLSFLNRFTYIQGRKPIIEFVAATTYDTVHLIGDSVKSAQSDSTSDIVKAITTRGIFQGVTGMITMSENGAAEIPLFLHKI